MNQIKNLIMIIFKKAILNQVKKSAASTCWGPCFQIEEPKNIDEIL